MRRHDDGRRARQLALNEVDVLDVAAAVSGGLRAELAELRGGVRRGDQLVPGAAAAAVERVAGEELDVRAHGLGPYEGGLRAGARGQKQRGQGRNRRERVTRGQRVAHGTSL